ncbi:hypothetical protein ABFX02_14G183400 [Erythranthe guttata]
MKDFPSCFGENGVQVAAFSSSNTSGSSGNYNSRGAASPQNAVASIYQCKFHTKPCWITVTWIKNLMGQTLTVGIDDDDNNTNQSLCKMDIKPWLFSKKKGSKVLEADSFRIDVYWDLSSAKFGPGPEPIEGFYVGIVFEKEMVLVLGDLRKEALKRTNCTPSLSRSVVLVSKREHIFGKKVFATKAKFSDFTPAHDLVIECDNSMDEPFLAIRLDSKLVVHVRRLRWKFRGNDTIRVDGVDVEVFWDVHNWLFGTTSFGNGVFMFKTRDSCSGEKYSSRLDDVAVQCSWSQRLRDSRSESVGFSLVLYAWKNE